MAVAVNPGTVVQRAGQHASLPGLRTDAGRGSLIVVGEGEGHHSRAGRLGRVGLSATVVVFDYPKEEV